MTPFTQFLTALRTADEQATKGPWYTDAVFDLYRTAIVAPDVPDEGSPNVIANTLCNDDYKEEIVQAEKDAAAIALWRNSMAQTIAIMEVARKAIEDAPHERNCLHTINRPCDCWKATTLAEMDAIAAKTP